MTKTASFLRDDRSVVFGLLVPTTRKNFVSGMFFFHTKKLYGIIFHSGLSTTMNFVRRCASSYLSPKDVEICF